MEERPWSLRFDLCSERDIPGTVLRTGRGASLEFPTLGIPDGQSEESRHRGRRERRNSFPGFSQPGKDLPAESEEIEPSRLAILAHNPNSVNIYFHGPCENATLQKVSLKGALYLTLES